VLTPQQISDQIEVTQVLNRYFRAIDTKDWDLLDTVFTRDAKVRYTTPSEIETTYAKMKPILAMFTDTFFFTQHSAGQIAVEVDGDVARSSNNLHAIHVQETREGEQNTWIVYGDYSDKLVRTPDGWRIAERSFRGSHTEGELLPADRVKSFPVPRHLLASA
jgi:3-phenylpropionate/cinnamic acid dioxygenase small subunit